jgi:fumarate reductase flavoprotein subunit
MKKRTNSKNVGSRGTAKSSDSSSVADRRGFLRAGLGLAAAGGAAGFGASEAMAGAPHLTEKDTGGHVDYDVDVVVAGSGNGGMSSAIAAAKGGARTLLIEISTQIGGNSLMSGGILHTAGQRTWEDYNKYTLGLHDQVLAKVYVETFWNEYIPWLQSHSAYMSRPTPETPGYFGDWHFGKGEPGQLRHKLYFDSLVKAYEGAGGKRLMRTRVMKLLVDSEGRVMGLRARVWRDSPRDEDQRWITIRAKKTIMATGGWTMDGERKATFLGRDGYMSQQYCGPFGSGEGQNMCEAAGAGLSKSGWSSFCGGTHAITATPLMNADMDAMFKLWDEVPPEHWHDTYFTGRLYPPGWIGVFPQFGMASRGILINNRGERFIDEGSPIHARYPRISINVVRQPGGYAWVVVDKVIFDKTPGSDAVVKKIIAEGGSWGTHGNVIIAQSLKELADALGQAGVYRGAFLKTIEEYNRAVDSKTQEDLAVSHYTGNDSGGYAIRTPPFYAIPIRANPYVTFGGVRINEHGQALDPQGVPVPSLYAPPPLGGGIQNEIYAGAIGMAGVFGYLAGKHAAQALKKIGTGKSSKTSTKANETKGAHTTTT